MDGNSVYVYKLVNVRGEVYYVKFYWKSLQGQKNFDLKQVVEVQGCDYSYMINDLVSVIWKGDFLKWDLYIQVFEFEDLVKFDFDLLDVIKIWLGIFECKIGQMVLNCNVDNFFQEIEQVVMVLLNLVLGIEFFEDCLFQGWLFVYVDIQMYWVGVNGLGLLVNCLCSEVNIVNQDGVLNVGYSISGVNYQLSWFDLCEEQVSVCYVWILLSGIIQQVKIQCEQNFKQIGELFCFYGKKDQVDLIVSFGGVLVIIDDESKYIMFFYFYKVDSDYGMGLVKVVGVDLQCVW